MPYQELNENKKLEGQFHTSFGEPVDEIFMGRVKQGKTTVRELNEIMEKSSQHGMECHIDNLENDIVLVCGEKVDK